VTTGVQTFLSAGWNIDMMGMHPCSSQVRTAAAAHLALSCRNPWLGVQATSTCDDNKPVVLVWLCRLNLRCYTMQQARCCQHGVVKSILGEPDNSAPCRGCIFRQQAP
jgi:hypothetical protein